MFCDPILFCLSPLTLLHPPISTLFPYTTLFRSNNYPIVYILYNQSKNKSRPKAYIGQTVQVLRRMKQHLENQNRKQLTDTLFIGDRKSTRLNSSHVSISYAVFCLKKKNKNHTHH